MELVSLGVVWPGFRSSDEDESEDRMSLPNETFRACARVDIIETVA